MARHPLNAGPVPAGDRPVGALVGTASRRRRRHALAAEVAALEADEDDRREMRDVAALMESLRAAG